MGKNDGEEDVWHISLCEISGGVVTVGRETSLILKSGGAPLMSASGICRKQNNQWAGLADGASTGRNGRIAQDGEAGRVGPSH